MFLRAVAQPLMAKVKSSTGIVGLEVVPHARESGIDRWGVPKHVPLSTEFHKTLEALTSQSGNHTPAASSSESPSHIRALVSQFEYIFIFLVLNCLREVVSDSKQFLWDKTWAPKNFLFHFTSTYYA
ncbi:hypothetical protein JHK86_045341 [Glycine max]|nr:hypothetical protein JHK86_045341 [Glycine max]